MIEIFGLTMQLPGAGRIVTILDEINLRVPDKQFVAIVGPSGSGKSTLLALIAGLDRPSQGSVVIDQTSLSDLSEDQLAKLRRQKIGMIFQSFHLIPTLNALENVQVPLELRGDADADERGSYLLEMVGLSERKHHYPVQLSGGEQQRVAVARAYASQPDLLLADEPTGNLDSKNGQRIVDLLLNLHQEHGSTLVLVTHDTELARLADRTITLHDGKIVEDTMNEA